MLQTLRCVASLTWERTLACASRSSLAGHFSSLVGRAYIGSTADSFPHTLRPFPCLCLVLQSHGRPSPTSPTRNSPCTPCNTRSVPTSKWQLPSSKVSATQTSASGLFPSLPAVLARLGSALTFSLLPRTLPHLASRTSLRTYRDRLSAGIIVAGWDKENGGTVYNIPLGGGMFKGPWAIGGAFVRAVDILQSMG